MSEATMYYQDSVPRDWHGKIVRLLARGDDEPLDCKLLSANDRGVLVRADRHELFYPWGAVAVISRSMDNE